MIDTSDLQAQALRHRSARGASNERLEFLGDAVVNLVAAELLYERFPQLDEGALTRLRARLVCERGLADIARELALGDRIELGPGELKAGGHRRDSILADALEALVAAIFLQQGFSASREQIRIWMEPHVLGLDPSDAAKDAKTRLQEWCQGRGLPLPKYELISAEGPDHAREFLVRCMVEGRPEALAKGSSRKLAEARAADALLAAIERSPSPSSSRSPAGTRS